MPVEPNLYDDAKLAEMRASQEDPLVQYIIVRKSLLKTMSRGKLGAQIGHAVGMHLLRYHHLKPMILKDGDKVANTDAWIKQSFRKVVLVANDSKWEKIKEELDCFVVKDAGLTEVDPGTETVIALWPMLRRKAPKLIQKLQVLK